MHLQSRSDTLTRCRGGFSLLELTIVVVIIGVLAAIAVPGYGKYKIRLYRREALATLEAIWTAEKNYFARRRTYTLTWNDLGVGDPNQPNGVHYEISVPQNDQFTATATYPAGGSCVMATDQDKTVSGGLIDETNWSESQTSC